MKRCPNCGEELHRHDRVCRNCGAFLDVEPTNESVFSDDDFPNEKETDNQDFLNIPSYSEVITQSDKPKPKGKFYWKAPVLFLILGSLLILSSIVIKTLEMKQDDLIKVFNSLGIAFYILAGIALIIVTVLYITKKEIHYTMTPREIIDSNASPAEQRRMAFVGKNYVKISKKNFSLTAMLFNWYYLLYRKRYLTAVLGMLLIIILTVLSNYSPIIKYIVIAIMVISSILLGLFFNKKYIKFINKKSKELKDKNSNLDVETFLKLCQKKGGTSLFSATIIYTLFLIIIVIVSILPASKTDKLSTNEKEEQLDVEVKVIDRDYQKRRSQCKNYAQAVYQSYLSANLEVNYIGCNMGKKKYVILKAKNPIDQSSYIAKYKIDNKNAELKLLNTTLEIDSLRQKQQTQTLTKEESKNLTEKETIEREFNSFDNKVIEDKTSYKENPTYIRNYIKIDINTLKN